MREIKFNINYNVKVKVTDFGREIFYHRNDKLNERLGLEFMKPRYPNVDSDGFSTFQLWDLMHTFGEFTSIGCDIPFETNIILVDAECHE